MADTAHRPLRRPIARAGGRNCLGFPSRHAAASALEAAGFTLPGIAEVLQTSVDNARALLRHARKAASGRPARASVQLVFAWDLIERLGPEAAKRGLHPAALAQQIVSHVLNDALVDAVMDDG